MLIFVYGMTQRVKNLRKMQDMQETCVQSLGQEDSPGRGHGNPLQYSYLENPTDRGAWWPIVHRVKTTQTQLKQLSMHIR